MKASLKLLLCFAIAAFCPRQVTGQVAPSGDLAPLLSNEEILRVREQIWSETFGLTYEEGSSSMLLTTANLHNPSWAVDLVTSRLEGSQASGIFVESARWDVPTNPFIGGSLSIHHQFIAAGLLMNPSTGSSTYVFGEVFHLNYGATSASLDQDLVVFLPLGVTLDEESALAGAARTALERQPSPPTPATPDCDDPCHQRCYDERIDNRILCTSNYYDCADAAALVLLECSVACAATAVINPIIGGICLAACVAIQQTSLNLCRSNEALCNNNASYLFTLCNRTCAQAPV